jgi:CRISPR/Cas system-associated endonuclease Cas1
VFCEDNGQPWHPDHVSKRFKKLAAQSGVPVVTLHEGGRHTGNSLMQDAGVDQELRMREVGHAGRPVNDRYTQPLEEAHLAALEQTAALVRKAGKVRKARATSERDRHRCSLSVPFRGQSN